LREQLVAFLLIAGLTSDHHIGPNGFSALGTWNYVIYGQISISKGSITILAPILIANHDIFAGTGQCKEFFLDITKKDYNRGYLKGFSR